MQLNEKENQRYCLSVFTLSFFLSDLLTCMERKFCCKWKEIKKVYFLAYLFFNQMIRNV